MARRTCTQSPEVETTVTRSPAGIPPTTAFELPAPLRRFSPAVARCVPEEDEDSDSSAGALCSVEPFDSEVSDASEEVSLLEDPPEPDEPDDADELDPLAEPDDEEDDSDPSAEALCSVEAFDSEVSDSPEEAPLLEDPPEPDEPDDEEELDPLDEPDEDDDEASAGEGCPSAESGTSR